MFKSWSFRLTVKADLGHGATAEEKGTILAEHLRARTGHTMPSSVTCVAVFCDQSLFSVPPDSAGLVSIEVQGYVQANQGKQLSTMQKWIGGQAASGAAGGRCALARWQPPSGVSRACMSANMAPSIMLGCKIDLKCPVSVPVRART